MAIINEKGLVEWIEREFKGRGHNIAACTLMLCEGGGHNKVYVAVKTYEGNFTIGAASQGAYSVFGCWGKNGYYPLNVQQKQSKTTEARADLEVKSLLKQKQAKGYRVFATGAKPTANSKEVIKFQQEAVEMVDRLLNTM